jgi:phage portal protein BeeE
VVTIEKQRADGDGRLNRLLQVRPNSFMTAYDLMYKLVTHYYLFNNAFAYLQKDDRGNLLGIWPLQPQQMEFVSDGAGELYCKFIFANGREYILPHCDVFIARRFFNSNDLLGDPNTAILPTLDLAHTQSAGLTAAIKSNATIRGLLK